MTQFWLKSEALMTHKSSQTVTNSPIWSHLAQSKSGLFRIIEPNWQTWFPTFSSPPRFTNEHEKFSTPKGVGPQGRRGRGGREGAVWPDVLGKKSSNFDKKVQKLVIMLILWALTFLCRRIWAQSKMPTAPKSIPNGKNRRIWSHWIECCK